MSSKEINYPIKGRKIRIGLVGCGRISNKHFDALKKHESDFELAFVCDMDEEKLAAAEAAHGVAGYSDLDEALKSTSVDMVTLCTPSGLHPQQAKIAAGHGVHVISEKPMAVKLNQAREMIQACEDAGVKLFIVKQNRFNATIQKVKEAIDQARFGRIFFVQVNVFWTRPQDYYDAAKWRGTWEFDGGALMNQASHYIDLLTWLIGPVDSVASHTATLDRKIEAEDTAAVSLKWRQGALGSVNVTMLTYPQNLEGSLTILGEKGTVKIGGVAVNKIETWDFAEKLPSDEGIGQQTSYQTESVYGFGHPAYYKNVIDCMRGEIPAMTSGREGAKSLELIEAIYLSAKNGQVTSLPLE